MRKVGGFYRSGAEVEIQGGNGDIKVEREAQAPVINMKKSIDTYAKVMD